MKKGILQISLRKIQEAFGRQRTSSEDDSSKSTTQAISSSVAANTELLSLEVVLPTTSVSRVNQLRTEIAQGAAFLFTFETGNATIPRGMICSNHIDTDDDVEYVTLAKGDPKALSDGITGGYSMRLPDQIEAAASGHHVIVHIIARASGSDQSRFAIAYSTNEVGNSGWHWFNAESEWSVYTMEYDVNVMKEGRGDFIGILPDSERNPGTDFCYFSITITKRIEIQNVLQQKNIVRRTIIVSSNCQTGGITAALQEIFWKDKVLAVPHPNFTNDQLLEHLSEADIWISSDRFDIAQKCLTTNPKLAIYKIPSLHFPAFHPDLIYANKISTNEVIRTPHDYHSAICVWGYKNNLEIVDIAALFTSEVYYKLGYFSKWKSSVDYLLQLFKSCNLDANLFLPFIIRQGLFMYSINHPKVYVLVRLAKMIAMQAGINQSILEKDINIRDGLTDIVWPVYPEIADFYALPGGSYDWKFYGNIIISGVNNYIEYSFNNFQSQRVESYDIKFRGRDESVYDHVLGPIAGVKK